MTRIHKRRVTAYWRNAETHWSLVRVGWGNDITGCLYQNRRSLFKMGTRAASCWRRFERFVGGFAPDEKRIWAYKHVWKPVNQSEQNKFSSSVVTVRRSNVSPSQVGGFIITLCHEAHFRSKFARNFPTSLPDLQKPTRTLKIRW